MLDVANIRAGINVDNSKSFLIKVNCKFCNGIGSLAVTEDMLAAAGVKTLKQFNETCPYCYGDGYLIESEDPIETNRWMHPVFLYLENEIKVPPESTPETKNE
jgi:hypothetical protein